MSTRTLTIQVAPEIAQAYEASPELQQQVDALVIRQIRRAMQESRLQSVQERGERAVALLRGSANAGLSTDEILNLTRGET